MTKRRPDNRITLNRNLAFVSGEDAANRNMRKSGRTKWNEEDSDIATETTNRLLLYVPFENGGLMGLDLSSSQREDLCVSEDVWQRAQREWRIGHNSQHAA